MATLYDISADLQALFDLIEELKGDISDPKIAELVGEFWNEAEGDFKAKADAYGAMIAEFEARAAIRKIEAARLTERKKIDERRAADMRNRLRLVMTANGMKKVETDRYLFTVKKPGGIAPMDIDEDAVPEEFIDFVPKVMTDAIREKLKAGEELPFARFKPRDTILQIK